MPPHSSGIVEIYALRASSLMLRLLLVVVVSVVQINIIIRHLHTSQGDSPNKAMLWPILKATMQKEVFPLPPPTSSPSSLSMLPREEVMKCPTCPNFYKLKEKFFWFHKACKC